MGMTEAYATYGAAIIAQDAVNRQLKGHPMAGMTQSERASTLQEWETSAFTKRLRQRRGNCDGCGAPLTLDANGGCEYCGRRP